MSLRVKSLLVFSITLILLFGIVLAIVETIVERQFNHIETDNMSRHARHVFVEIQEELDPVVSTVGDWAPWDELYDFVSGKNPAFLRRNLNEPVLTNLRLDFLAIWLQDGTLVAVQTRTPQPEQEQASIEEVLTAIRAQKLVPQQNIDHPLSGLILVGKQITIVACLPIVRSDRTGAPMGTLVGGRFLGPPEMKRIEEFSDYQVKFTPLPEELVHPTNPIAFNPSEPDIQIYPHKISATLPIFDLADRYIATAELTSARLLHTQAQKTIRILVIALASSAGILLFVVWYLLDANVIFPVRWLADRLAKAASDGDLPTNLNLKLKGGGELANLATRIEDLSRTVAFAEANYRAIVEDQTDFIFRYLPSGSITFVNKALCLYFNRTRENLLSHDAYAFVVEEDKRRVSETLRRLSVEAPVTTFDHRVKTNDGSIAWFRRTERAIFSPTGELREFQSVARDVTQAHLSRERIEASETRYRRLFETAADGIAIIKLARGAIAEVNPKLCQLLGLPHVNVVGRRIELLPPFNNRKTTQTLKKLLDGNQPVRGMEITLPSDNGELRYAEVTAGFYDEGGERVVQLNFRDITQRRRANDELRHLSGHLMRLQDAERRRIARELHDSTAQNLSALQMSITQIESFIPKTAVKARMALEEIRSLTDLSLNEIRTISYLLHPPLLDEVGLLFALRWYVDGFMTRAEKIVRLEMPDSLQRLQPEIETTIFRIVQEALGNVHRHSGARRAWIRLAITDGLIELEIRDDGRGITPTPSGYPILGVGIAGMRERLRQFGGSLLVESDRNGTVVKATLPHGINEQSDY